MSWDWIMSVDPHWFSTLFGWYVFASFLVSGVTVICLVTLYLKSKGYLEHVNTSHIHRFGEIHVWFQCFLDLFVVLSIHVDLVCQYSGRGDLFRDEN